MKKNYSYLTVLALFTITVCFIAFKYKRDEQVRGIAFYPLKERVGIMSQSEEANLVRKQFANLMKVARTNPDDIKSRIELASLYICEARITGNYLYYDLAALKCVDEVLAIDGDLRTRALRQDGGGQAQGAAADHRDLARAALHRLLHRDGARAPGERPATAAMAVIVHYQGVADHLRVETRTGGAKRAQANGDIEQPVLMRPYRGQCRRRIHGRYAGTHRPTLRDTATEQSSST